MKQFWLLLIALLLSSPALAQSNSSFLSSNGTVVNPFSITNTWSAVQTYSVMPSLPLAQNSVYAGNASGVATATTFSALIDAAIGSTRGSILERGASGWQNLGPCTTGLPLISNGAGADPSCQTISSGALSSGAAATNVGSLGGQLSGTLPNPSIASGTVTNSNLANMAAGTVKANPTQSSAAPQDALISSLTAVSTSSYGASGSNQTTTGTISATSMSLTITSAIDFANGEGIRINHAGPAFALNFPTAASVTPQGTTGSTTYQYKLASLDGAGGVGAAIATFQTTTGNATLSATNFNALSWTAATGTTPAGYAVYKSISGTFTLIGVATGTSFNDYGYTGWPFTDWIPTTAPGSSLADYLVTTISSGGGTTSLTLAATSTTAAISQTVTHDDTTAIQDTVNASTNVYQAPGTYYVSGQVNLPANAQLFGVPFQTQVRTVNIGQTVYNLSSGDSISGLQFLLLPNGNAISSNAQVIDRINNIRCLGSGTGTTGQPDCVNMFNVSYQWVDNVFLDGWAGAVGFGSGGSPPAIAVSGTSAGGNSNAVYLSHITMGNDASQINNQATISFNDAYNSSLSHSYINANSTSLATNWTGVEIEGPGQVIDIVDLQTLQFQSNLRMDSTGAGSPLDVKITNSHFDFCGQFCILLQAGSWVNITNSSFVGEAINSNIGIHASSSFTGSPLIINDNVFNGFSGTSSNPISLSGTMTNTTVAGNQFTNNGSNTSIVGTAGTGSAFGATCSAASPTSSFFAQNGIVGHC